MLKRVHLIILRLGRTWPVMVTIGLLATGIGWAWWENDLFSISDSERNAYDDGIKKFTGKDWFPWGKTPVSDKVVVIAIDDYTFEQGSADEGFVGRYGTWPYDRVIYADLIKFLSRCGAKQLIYDATIDEPRNDRGDAALASALHATGLPFYLGINVSPTAQPLPKANPINRLAVPPVETSAGTDAGSGPDEFPEDADEAAQAAETRRLAEERRTHAAEQFSFPVEVRGGLEVPTIPPVETKEGKPVPRFPVPSIEPLHETAMGFGLVLHEPDEDGKMRRTRFAYTDGVNGYVTLPIAAAADALGADKVIIEPHRLIIGARTIAIDADGAASIDYPGEFLKQYLSIPLYDVIQNRGATGSVCEKMKGRYVFLAGVATGASDSKATPLEAGTPGVAKQVAVFESLLFGEFNIDAPFWVSLLLTLVVSLGSASLVLVVRNAFVDIAWPVILYVGFFLVTGCFLAFTNVHVLSAMPSLAGAIASVLATTWERLFSSRERERLKEMFSSYMEADLVEAMAEQKELPKLDGENIRITAYFSDIKGFSTFSETFKDDPKKLMRLLNRYLTRVTPELTKQGACIDKYIGDAVVALFGCPISHEDHALRACQGALAVQHAIAELQEDLNKEGLPDITTRIGLNTDVMLVGNIGSQQLMDYTAIGDGMNLASRLEGTNKAYGTHILMGENTFLDVQEQVVAREVDLVRVAGKHVATRIYELVGLKGEVTAQHFEVLEIYAAALAHYRARRFGEALAALDKALTLEPEDGPSLTLSARCKKFLATPPPADWDGITDIEK